MIKRLGLDNGIYKRRVITVCLAYMSAIFSRISFATTQSEKISNLNSKHCLSVLVLHYGYLSPYRFRKKHLNIKQIIAACTGK